MSPATATSLDVPAYRAGSLVYTRGGLFVLSLWLLWGDFAFSFFESIFSRFFPIYLKELNASNTLIGIMTGSFAGVVNLFFLPGISRWSDNHRSRFGRRIPFLYVSTPLVVGALILTGFAPEIGGWIYDRFSLRLPDAVTRGGFILGLLCVLAVSFHFFNMVLVSSYNCLIRDVVPQEVIARFLAWFRIVGMVSSVFFLWYIFPHMLEHRGKICLGVGLFYLAAFLLMCARVREGEYPPIEKEEKRPGLFQSFAVYFRHCLQIQLYRRFFLVNLLVNIAITCAGGFTALFMRETLHIGMDEMGRIYSWTAAFSAIVFFPLGWLCDKISPLRVTLAAIVGLCIFPIVAYVAVHHGNAYLAYSLLFTLPTAGWALGGMASAMKLFPQADFGQFSGAVNIFACGGLIIGNFLIGLLMDLVQNDYRVAFLWITVFSGMAIFPMMLVIRGWKQYGGPDHYVPPLPK